MIGEIVIPGCAQVNTLNKITFWTFSSELGETEETETEETENEDPNACSTYEGTVCKFPFEWQGEKT